VIQELAKDMVKVAAAQDQMMVQQVAAGRANPPFGERIGTGGSVREADNPHSLAPEHLVEGAWELGVPIMEQDPRRQLTIM
jgi:hypothetical protein